MAQSPAPGSSEPGISKETGRVQRRRQSKVSVMIGAIAGIAIVTLYWWINPASSWWIPKCPVKWLTGLDCPGCGSQRAFHVLLRGDLEGAFHFNPLLFIIIPYLLLLAYAESHRRRCKRLLHIMIHPAAIVTVISIIAIWTVVRNVWPGLL